MELVKRIRKELGITVFWVEHVMKAVMGVVDRIVVIHHGVKLSEGSPKTISGDKKVIDAYLGERYVF
jgi:branched-chain amino acid transport system ATP-binding protein